MGKIFLSLRACSALLTDFSAINMTSSPLLVSLCLATICAWNSQLPGYHPKQSSNFTSLPHYACPESSSLQAEPTSLFMLGCTQYVQGLSLSTLFKLASLRLIHHQGDPQIPTSTLTWRLCSVAHLQPPAGHRHLNAPSSLLTGKTKHDIALRSHGAQRQCLCSPSHTNLRPWFSTC